MPSRVIVKSESASCGSRSSSSLSDQRCGLQPKRQAVFRPPFFVCLSPRLEWFLGWDWLPGTSLVVRQCQDGGRVFIPLAAYPPLSCGVRGPSKVNCSCELLACHGKVPGRCSSSRTFCTEKMLSIKPSQRHMCVVSRSVEG